MIESVFTLVPMFAIIFAFMDFGLMIYRWSTLQNAVREGCRYAVTFQTNGGAGQDASIEAVVQTYAMGLVKTTDSPNRIIVNYYTQSNLNTPVAVGASPAGNVPGNVVEVSVQAVPLTWLMPISGVIGTATTTFYASNPISLNVYSSDILGGYPAGVNSVTR